MPAATMAAPPQTTATFQGIDRNVSKSRTYILAKSKRLHANISVVACIFLATACAAQNTLGCAACLRAQSVSASLCCGHLTNSVFSRLTLTVLLCVWQELAYKLVAKMGWSEGKGLGRENKGIVKHIWTKKRNDQVGLGGEVGNDWGAHSIQTNTYNSLLSKLAVITNDSGADSDSDSDAGVKAKKKKADTKMGKKGKKGIDSNSEEDIKKSDKKKKKKKSKKAASSDSESSDEDVSKAASSNCDDYGSARKAGRSYAAAAVKEAKASTASLRYAYKRSQMNKTKDVKAYSASDLAQIMGFSVVPKEEDEALLQQDGIKKYGKAETARSKAADSSSEEDSDNESAAKKRKRGGEDTKQKKGGIVIGTQKRAPMKLPPLSKLTGVLSHMFLNGGFLSGDNKQKEQDWQFDEATQEKIAVDAHNNKVTGKKGLGFDNDRPTKLGKDYTGSKKTFDNSDDEDAKGKKEDQSEDQESEEERKKRRKAEKKSKKAAAAAAEAEADKVVEEEVVSEKKKKKKKKTIDPEEVVVVEEEEAPKKKKKKKHTSD